MPFESFEERLRQRFDADEITPGVGVWPEIESRLQQPRRRAMVWWTWSAAASVVLILGIWGVIHLGERPFSEKEISPLAQKAPARMPLPDATASGQAAATPAASPSNNQNQGPRMTHSAPLPVKQNASASLTAYSEIGADNPGVPQVKPQMTFTANSNRERFTELSPVSANTVTNLYAGVISPAPHVKEPSGESGQAWWATASETRVQTDHTWSFGAYGRQENYSAGVPFASQMESEAARYYVDKAVNNGTTSDLALLWNVQSPARQFSGGLVTAYRLGNHWELESGLGIFQSDSARILSGYAQDATSIPTTGNVAQGYQQYVSVRSFQLQGFEAPLRLRYRFGKGAWQGDVTAGTALRVRIGKESPWISESDFSSGPLAELNNGPTNPLLSLGRTLWSGYVECGVSRQVAPGVLLRVGPVAGVQAGNWLRGEAAVNPKPWTVGLQAGVRFR
jgi:hypothetical protein